VSTSVNNEIWVKLRPLGREASVHRKAAVSHSGRRNGRNGARTISSVIDRRVACRYPAAIKALILSLIESGSLVDHRVELENVSMQGCLVKSRRGPRVQPGERVWLKVLGNIITPVIAGIVVSAVKPFLGKRSIRVRFLAPLSYQTFKLLVCGSEGIDMNLRDRPVHESDHYWR